MQKRTRVALSAACGVFAVVLSVAYADAAKGEAEAARAEALARYGGEVTNLVVARSGMSAGDIVSQSDVEVREWLVDLAPTGALSSVDDVVGLRLTSAVAAGSPLSEVDFAGSDGSLEVPDGRVAISVRLSDKTGVSGPLAAGSRLLAYEVTQDGPSLISGDVTVVGTSSLSTTQTSSASSLTIAVEPDDVTRVLAAGADGTLRLAVPAEGVGSSGDSADDAAAPSSVGAEGADEDGSESEADTSGADEQGAAATSPADATTAGGGES